MAYTITNSDSSVTITVQDTTVDTTYALKLIGRNVSGYGQYFVENTVRQLENFASTVQPSGVKLEGQIWYDKGEKLLKVWTGSNWKRATNIVIGTSEPSNPVAGDAWYRTDNNKLYIYDGSDFKLSGYAGEVSDAYSGDVGVGSPSNYGTKLRNIYLTDSTGKAKPVLALTMVNDGTVNGGATVTTDGKETIMAIFSDHPEFTAKNDNSLTEGSQVNYYAELSGSGGIGTQIKPGLNLRSEYADTAVALSERAYRADASYQLNLGSPGSDAGNIDASWVAYNRVDFIPNTTNSIQLGNDQKHFAGLYTNFIRLGEGGSAALEANGSVTIGNSSSRVNKVWTQDLDVSGDVTFASGVQNIGTSGNPVENFYSANAVISSSFTVGSSGSAYTLPASDGSANQALLTDGSGSVSFGNVALSTTQMIAGDGLTGGGTLASNRTFNVGAGSYITVAADTVSVDGTVPATASKVVVRTGTGGINSVGLDAGSGIVQTTGTVQFGILSDGSLAITDFENSLSSSATKIPTSSAVKTYVDAQVTAQDLDFQGDTGGTLSIDLDSETLDIAGGTNINTAGSGNTLTVNLDTNLTGMATADFSGNVDALNFNGVASSAKYADLAEIYKADADYEPGTVVKIGGQFEITQTLNHNDVDVFGVISTNPAYLMNKDAEGLAVALKGRIPVKVLGKVKKGDRLCSSDEPGVAWVVSEGEYDVRAVIGRSLEDKDSGDFGVVEAVIGVK